MSIYKNRDEVLLAASQAAVDARRMYDQAPSADRDNLREVARAASKAVIALNAKDFNESTAGFDTISSAVQTIAKGLADAKSGMKTVADVIDGIAKAADAIQNLLEGIAKL